MRKLCLTDIVVFVFFITACTLVNGDEYIQAVGLIHMDSEISGGDNSLAMLAAAAKNAEADLAIVTDHDTQKATYGFWPLRKLLRVSHSRASVRKYGVSRYLDEIAAVDRDLDGFDFMPGIEAVPYYNWERNALQDKLILKNLHRHMLVMGLSSAEDIEHLPSIETGYPAEYTLESLYGLLWIIPLFVSFILFKPPDTHRTYYRSWMEKMFTHPMNFISLPMMTLSIVFLVNCYPFKEPLVNQYGADAGSVPYQTVIDYVNNRGGLVFWAHPEASYSQRISSEQSNPFINAGLKMVLRDGLEIVTDSYYSLLNNTFDYTGFALFFEGYRYVGNPGGLWDSLLMQFCKGTRKRPVWAISEIDMEHGTDPETASESQTVFLVREKSKENYLDALKNGRVYCFTKGLTRWVTIRDYSVTAVGKKAVSGEILGYGDDAILSFDMNISKRDLNFDVVVVKDGAVLGRFEYDGSGPLTIPLEPPENDVGYVRLVLYQGGEMVIATNPIFYVK